jgi:D-amino peptidase
MMEGLDETFDAVFFIGYHGSISGEPSTLSHTYNPEVISGVRLNGEYVGESGINALVAADLGVPIALVSGDSVTSAEMASVAPDCHGGRHQGVPEPVQRPQPASPDRLRLIEERAASAVRAVAEGMIAPPSFDGPTRLEVELATADMAEVASWVKGVERSGTRTAEISGRSGVEMFRSFVALTYITRQAGGR